MLGLLDLVRCDRRLLIPIAIDRIDDARACHRELFWHHKLRGRNAAEPLQPGKELLERHVCRAEQVLLPVFSLFECGDESRGCVACIDEIQAAARAIRYLSAE